MFSVYVLKSCNCPKSYVGFTDNFERRFSEHNTGKSFYTRKYAPWKLLHIEEYETRSEAMQRERFLKSGAGRRYLKKFFE